MSGGANSSGEGKSKVSIARSLTATMGCIFARAFSRLCAWRALLAL